jgi:hypothetical protein
MMPEKTSSVVETVRNSRYRIRKMMNRANRITTASFFWARIWFS